MKLLSLSLSLCAALLLSACAGLPADSRPGPVSALVLERPVDIREGRARAYLQDGEVVFSEELNAVFEGLKELGLYGLSIPRELGGSNCPMALYFVAGELMARADVSVMTHFSFHGGIASAMLLYADKEGSSVYENGRLVKTRWEKEIAEIAAGENFGCMVLTEPGAGSDLAAIRATAEERDGKWYLNGEKIFITSGHGQYQFVLAKTEPDGGLKSLSLFLVPRKVERDGKTVDNVVVTKVEEKLGHHGSATCSLQYEDSVGELVGPLRTRTPAPPLADWAERASASVRWSSCQFEMRPSWRLACDRSGSSRPRTEACAIAELPP